MEARFKVEGEVDRISRRKLIQRSSELAAFAVGALTLLTRTRYLAFLGSCESETLVERSKADTWGL